MKIELFTEVNFRGPTAKNGKCIALVECETKKGPAVKAQIETEQKTTKPGNMRAFIYPVSKKMRKVRRKGTKK